VFERPRSVARAGRAAAQSAAPGELGIRTG
jgi:hypothetical protein